MQSTTQIPSNQLQNCMVEVGRWAYAQGVGSPARETYQAFYETYLATGMPGMGTAAPSAGRTAQRQRNRTGARVRTRTAATRTRTAGQTSAAPPSTRSPRVRTPAGTPGPSVAKVLNRICASPGINIEGLRKNVRGMEPNIIGTALTRLFKAGHISGTPKVGPFNPTTAGIEANNKQPTSINTRRRTTGKTAQVTEPAGQMQQTG